MATSIRLAPETGRRLDFLAVRTGRTKAFYLRELIERGDAAARVAASIGADPGA